MLLYDTAAGSHIAQDSHHEVNLPQALWHSLAMYGNVEKQIC